MRALGAFALSLSLCLAARAHAQDRPRCAVLPLDGSGTVVVRRSLMRALEDHGGVEVIGEDEVDDAASGGASAHVVADRLDAAFAISGEVEGRGDRRRLRLEAVDREGETLGSVEIRLRSGGAGRRALDDGVEELLGAVLPRLGSGAAREEEEPAETPRTPPPRETTVSTEPSFGEPARIIAARLGVVIRTRDAETVLASGMPRSWSASPAYLELWAGAELRPLARNDDYARGLFLRADVAVAAGLGSRDERGASVSTEFFRVAGDLGYLVPIGALFEVGAAFGGGFDAYHLGANTIYPGIELGYVRPAARARLRVVGETFVIGAELGYRAVVARDSLSAAFGGGDTHGFDVGGSLSGTIELGPDLGGIAYGVDVTWVGLWHSFSGTGSFGAGARGTESGLRALISAGWAY